MKSAAYSFGMAAQQAMMSRGSRNDRVSPADLSIDVLEALKEARQSAAADSDVLSDLNFMVSQFSGYHANSLFCFGVLYPQKILGEQLTEAKVCLTDALGGDGATVLQPSRVDHC